MSEPDVADWGGSDDEAATQTAKVFHVSQFQAAPDVEDAPHVQLTGPVFECLADRLSVSTAQASPLLPRSDEELDRENPEAEDGWDDPI